MKILYVVILIIVVAVAGFYGITLYQKSQKDQDSQPKTSIEVGAGSNVTGFGGGQSDHIGNENKIPQRGDLCGGTGGNGQIVSLGNNEIIMRLNDGSSHIIYLTSQTTIKTSADSDSASESDLKTGERITMGGKPNPDGSFTAKIVVVCNEN